MVLVTLGEVVVENGGLGSAFGNVEVDARCSGLQGVDGSDWVLMVAQIDEHCFFNRCFEGGSGVGHPGMLKVRLQLVHEYNLFACLLTLALA